MKNIILVGFMGTGKTAVARALSKNLKREYVCLDELIEKKEKRAVSEIFRDSGEACFRKVEGQVVKEASKKNNAVIDTGGGVVLADENWINLRKNGIIICLNAAPEVILQRVKRHTHRPLLNVKDPMAKIKELLSARAPFYAKADFQVDTSDLSVKQVVEKIMGIANLDN